MNNPLCQVMQEEHPTIDLKFQFEVAQLTARDVLVLTCEECHWATKVYPHVLFARNQDYTKVIDIPKDMACKQYEGGATSYGGLIAPKDHSGQGFEASVK